MTAASDFLSDAGRKVEVEKRRAGALLGGL